MNNKDFFHFKHFKLKNKDSALKINVDGVLLAAWVKVANGTRILDIGTGGGVIACILAHRYPSIKIDGIDIDEASITEATFNGFSNDFDLLGFIHTRLQDHNPIYNYSHIVSNPPYFSGNSDNSAKHDNMLTLSELVAHAYRLLSEDGRLSLIIPEDKKVELDRLCEAKQLKLNRACAVSGKKGGAIKRWLLEYAHQPSPQLKMDQLHIRDAENGTKGYGEKYIALTKELYLNF